jgi:hypothetical protein
MMTHLWTQKLAQLKVREYKRRIDSWKSRKRKGREKN